MPNAEVAPSRRLRNGIKLRIEKSPRKSGSTPPPLWATAQEIAHYPHPSYWFEPESKQRTRRVAGWIIFTFGAVGGELLAARPSPEINPAWTLDVMVVLLGLMLVGTASKAVLYFWLDRIADELRHWIGIVATWAAVVVLALSWIALGQVDYAHVPSSGLPDFEDIFRDRLVVLWIGASGMVLGLLGSWSAGALINVRRGSTSYLRRRSAGRVVLLGIISNAAQATVFILTSLDNSSRPLVLSLLLAIFLGAYKWQWQRLADNDKTKDQLRTLARKAHVAFLQWGEDAMTDPATARSTQRAALSALDDLGDVLKVGNIAPVGSRMADSGTLIVLEFLQEALPLPTSMDKHYQGIDEPRYPDPLRNFQKMPPTELRKATTGYLQQLFDYIEGTRYIRRVTPSTPSDDNMEVSASDAHSSCRRFA